MIKFIIAAAVALGALLVVLSFANGGASTDAVMTPGCILLAGALISATCRPRV
jgi:hypothetical protein